uniref:MSMEG_0567/Sll0786 family nitrogen starvation N-acetyltransferase n=1 Tax=Nocardia miyunensis TaxID=282684 RepID=UPI000A7EC2C7
MQDGTSNPAAAPAVLSILAGEPRVRRPEFIVTVADARTRRDHLRLRHREFVERQKLFARTDLDEFDADPQTITLVAVSPDGAVLGGVRLVSHRDPATGADIGWWSGSRLAVVETRHARGVGAALVRAACAHVESAGALRFDATVQDRHVALFRRLGWDDTGPGPVVGGRAHRRMRWPVGLVQHAVDATKAPLGALLTPFLRQPHGLGSAGFRGDDGAPVPGTQVIAACDAILPSMLERDPEWAGWCSVLVNVNDLAAMGARPVGLLDAVA